MLNWTEQQRARGCLWAVMLVLCLCLAKQSSWIQGCPLQQQALPQASLVATSATSDAASALASESDCSASEQLLQQALQQLFDQVSVGLLLVVALLFSSRLGTTAVTLTVPPPRWRYRPHLHFCVFRE
ncbi:MULTISPECIES: hypothetical protein [Pseudidiomarina]|uniref:Uncharacterized protein n=2 Tax=Pseudidiomarina TaxID=2800384 RepID=A0A368UPK0_9GAMM|nr:MULTISPECIES: hypothetical protein [Pseudidiomarina]PWW10444.1 hypothetical protein DET45_11425 [Pseudidiomarina maritima]RBP88084.1 hypothetical protein DFO81_11625 [Pseudidiomarina tainanensis]RCW30095.1 hypothetical protein DFO79_11525 [Pseudidiomarina tainanensis]